MMFFYGGRDNFHGVRSNGVHGEHVVFGAHCDRAWWYPL